MNMTYNQVLQMLSSFFQQHEVGFVTAASPELQEHKALKYTPGVNCNARGFDICTHTKTLDNQNIILRYKKNPTIRARVFFVLPEAEEQFRLTHPNFVRDPFE